MQPDMQPDGAIDPKRAREAARNARTESQALYRIDRDALSDTFEHEAARSVYDEPGFSPELAGEKPAHALTYAALIEKGRAETGPIESWLVVLGLACSSGFAAIIGAFFAGFAGGSAPPGGVFAIGAVFIAPPVEEVLKTALLLAVLERRPWLFRSTAQIVLVGVCSGLAFAAVENLLYLNVSVPNPSSDLIAWRWTICVGLHMGCTAIASLGLVKVWRRSMREHAKPRAELGAEFLVAAITVHGLYNILALVLDLSGVF